MSPAIAYMNVTPIEHSVIKILSAHVRISANEWFHSVPYNRPISRQRMTNESSGPLYRRINVDIMVGTSDAKDTCVTQIP